MSNRLNLPDVTLLAIDCVDLSRVLDIARIWNRKIQFGEIKILSSIPSTNSWVNRISPISSKEEYSRFVIQELSEHVTTSHVLIFQYDGFILNPEAWTNDFLQYDYIGAPWWFTEGNNVGNGGFSLRSKKLLEFLKNDHSITEYHPEDLVICRTNYESLVASGIRFAPEALASKFSFEGRWEQHDQWKTSFGFHGYDVTDVSAWNYSAYTRLFSDWRFLLRHYKRRREYKKLLKEWKSRLVFEK